MRFRVAFVVFAALFAACSNDDDTCTYNGRTYHAGDQFPSGDGCNSCSCTNQGVACTAIACDGDGGLDTPVCGASNGCASGPWCGEICCHAGESCNGGECRCGTGPACDTGDVCASAGPTGEDQCGSICCGQSGPCPL